MRVRTCVDLLSESTRRAILSEQDRRLEQPWPGDLANRLTDEAFLARLWQRLHALERETVRLFVLEAPHGFLTKRQWDSLSKNIHPHLSVGLTRLRRLGLIVTVRKLWSEVGYLMPAEIRERMDRLLESADKKEDHLDWQDDQPLSYYITAGRGIHLDLFACLLFVRDQDVRLTQKRTIHRRQLQKLAPLLSVREEHVAGWHESLVPRELRAAYRPEEAILFDIAMRLGLITCEERRLALNEPAVRTWLSLDAVRRREELFRLFLASYLPRQPWLEAFAREMNRTAGGWRSVEAGLEQLRRRGYRLPDNALDVLRTQWLHPLLGFGWIHLGETPDGRLCWRFNPLLQAPGEGRWYAEPTGGLIVPPTVPLVALWELGRLGDFSFEGELLRCTLSSRRVAAYLSGGGSDEEILAFLARYSAYPLPDALAALIRRWAKTSRQIRFDPVVRVRTADPGLLAELREIPLLQPFLADIISPTDFLIPASREAELFRLLRQCGFEPLAGTLVPFAPLSTGATNQQAPGADADGSGASQTDAPDSARVTVASAGLFDTAAPWDGYQVENVFPDEAEAMPQLSLLPKMWVRHYQAYHPQTLRDLFKRAQELQLEVRLERSDGEEWQGLVEKVEVEMGYWTVTVETERRKRRTRLEDVRRVRLLVPDYL